MLELSSPSSDGERGNASRSSDVAAHGIRRGPLADRIRAWLNGIDSAFRAILVIALVIQLAIVLTGIVSRFWFDESLLWADEAAKLFLSLTSSRTKMHRGPGRQPRSQFVLRGTSL